MKVGLPKENPNHLPDEDVFGRLSGVGFSYLGYDEGKEASLHINPRRNGVDIEMYVNNEAFYVQMDEEFKQQLIKALTQK